METSKHFAGGRVMVVALIGRTKALLIKETTKPVPHYYKLPSETCEPTESVLDTLRRGVQEEVGLELKVARKETGEVERIIDDRVTIKELLPPHEVAGRYPHTRYFYGVLTSDEVVMSLSGKHLTGDKNEEIDTQAFNLSELEGMVDLLPQHRELILKLRQPRAA